MDSSLKNQHNCYFFIIKRASYLTMTWESFGISKAEPDIQNFSLIDKTEKPNFSVLFCHCKPFLLKVAMCVYLLLQDLYAAGEGKFGTDEEIFITILGKRSAEHLRKGESESGRIWMLWPVLVVRHLLIHTLPSTSYYTFHLRATSNLIFSHSKNILKVRGQLLFKYILIVSKIIDLNNFERGIIVANKFHNLFSLHK